MQHSTQEVLQCTMSHPPGVGIRTRERIKVKVEVLYLKGCPNHEPAVEQVQKALRSEGLPILVNEVELTDPAMAQEVGFLGSPSIRIDGIDVGPGAREVKTFGFSCRTYSDDEGRRSGLPQSASSNRRRVKAEARELKTNKQFGVSCSRRRCRRPRIFLLPGATYSRDDGFHWCMDRKPIGPGTRPPVLPGVFLGCIAAGGLSHLSASEGLRRRWYLLFYLPPPPHSGPHPSL
jgi:hypothetical protein